MFEIHAWAVLRKGSGGGDLAEMQSLIATIGLKLSDASANWAASGIKFTNGYAVAWMHGFTNHKDDRAILVFHEAARLAPNSYGIICYWDDEDVTHDNAFRIFRIARGGVTEQQDAVLSPCVPTIDDG